MQIQLQLKGEELAKATALLDSGLYGLEVLDFASPALLSGAWEEHLEAMQAFCARLPGPITMHGPFLDLSPASPDPGVRELTRHRYLQALAAAEALGARYLVLHSQFNPNLGQPDYPKLWRDNSRRFFLDLLPDIRKAKTMVLLENVWDPSPEHLASLLAELPKETFAACFDVAHARLYSPMSAGAWVQALGPRLAYVHLSDNHGGYDQHLPLGEGSVDFEQLFVALNAREKKPWLVLEVETWEATVASLECLAALGVEPSKGSC